VRIPLILQFAAEVLSSGAENWTAAPPLSQIWGYWTIVTIPTNDKLEPMFGTNGQTMG
jgi:hypothetical protein